MEREMQPAAASKSLKNVPNSTAVSVQQTPTVYICMFALAVASTILRDCLEVFPPTI